jgi:hypothetical protein
MAIVREPANRKRIFQVAYREEHFLARARLLRRQGYAVISAIGNDAAQAVLPWLPEVHLLIIGHAAPAPTRLAMAKWLGERYPHTPILALNPWDERLDGPPSDAAHHSPLAWLPLIAAVLVSPPSPSPAL